MNASNDKDSRPAKCEEAAEVQGWINAIGRSDGSHVCEKLGRWARECPTGRGKGKGGGKGAGGFKGRGKGGPVTACWDCGGEHVIDNGSTHMKQVVKRHGKRSEGKKGG